MAIISFMWYLKDKKKQHLVTVVLLIAIALGWTGITITFFAVVIYGSNPYWVKPVISYFSYCTVPVGSTAIIFFTWDVFGYPKFKKPIIGVYFSLMALYYIFLYATFQQAVACPPVSKGEIYDDWLKTTSVVYYLLLFMVSITAVMTIIGFNKFRKMTAGDVKKRAGIVILASFIIAPGILLDTVILGSIITPHVHLLFIVRFVMIFGTLFTFWAIIPSKKVRQK